MENAVTRKEQPEGRSPKQNARIYGVHGIYRELVTVTFHHRHLTFNLLRAEVWHSIPAKRGHPEEAG
jgi:hypothetical protein